MGVDLRGDRICVELSGQDKWIPVQRDLPSLLNTLWEQFDEALPQKWKLEYTLDVNDSSTYYEFLSREARNLRIVPLHADDPEEQHPGLPQTRSLPHVNPPQTARSQKSARPAPPQRPHSARPRPPSSSLSDRQNSTWSAPTSRRHSEEEFEAGPSEGRRSVLSENSRAFTPIPIYDDVIAVEGEDFEVLRQRAVDKLCTGTERQRGTWRQPTPHAHGEELMELPAGEVRQLEKNVQSTQETEGKLERKDIEMNKRARDAVLLEDIKSMSTELVREDSENPPKPKTVVLERPPINAYEACAKFGVESAALAYTSPPLLKSPRYRASTSPVPHLPPELQRKMEEGRKLLPHIRVVKKPRKEGGLQVFEAGSRIPYSDILRKQSEELDGLEVSKRQYDHMLSTYEAEMEETFARNRKLVEEGTWLPVDKETLLKRNLAEMVGMDLDLLDERAERQAEAERDRIVEEHVSRSPASDAGSFRIRTPV